MSILSRLTHAEVSQAPRYIGGWSGGLMSPRRDSVTSVAEEFLRAYWSKADRHDADLVTRMVLRDGAVFKLWWTFELGTLRCSRYALALVCRDGATAPLLFSHPPLTPDGVPPPPPVAPTVILWRDGVAWANGGFLAHRLGPRDVVDEYLQAYSAHCAADDNDGVRTWAARGAVVKMFVTLSDELGPVGYSVWLFRDAQAYRPLMSWPALVMLGSKPLAHDGANAEGSPMPILGASLPTPGGVGKFQGCTPRDRMVPHP